MSAGSSRFPRRWSVTPAEVEAESRLYVSVNAGDITVWAVHGGHAYPFEQAESARYALARISRGQGSWTTNDEGFEALRADNDVWWDVEPEALAVDAGGSPGVQTSTTN